MTLFSEIVAVLLGFDGIRMKHPAFRWVCVVLLGLGFPTWAQQTKPQASKQAPAATPAVAHFTGKLSSEPEQFITDVQAMMAIGNSAAAKASGAKMQQLWASNKLTATQQAKIVALSQQMLTKHFKPRPHFESLFKSITAAAMVQSFSDQQMDELLDVISKTVEKDPGPDAEKFLNSTAQFLTTRALYNSRYSTLRVAGGTFSFAYNETDNPLPAPVPIVPPKPVAPAPAPTPAAPAKATPAKAAKPVAKPAPKKKSSSGWDTGDLWGDSGSSGSSGWGNDDGWGTPKKKPVAKAPVKTPAKAATPAKAPEPEPEPEPEPSPAVSYDTYMAPPTRGPVLVIKDADLYMATGGDSIVLHKTSGIVVASSHRFVGQGGQYAWSVKGNPVTADLTSYDFDLNKPEFTAQPVTLTYPAVLEAPIQGALSYKGLKKKPGATDTGYPRFISLTNDARVKNIGQNIRYYGGFSMSGGRTLSAALDQSLSRIFVDVDGKTKFRAASRAYTLGDSIITADRASVTIFQDKADSLTHPGVKLKFAKKGEVLQLTRESGLYKTTPYVDSYHQMEISTEMLTWPLRTPYIDFAILTAKNQVTANFESKEFYTNTRYQQIKAINKLHPLQMVVGYSQNHGNVKRFTVQDLCQDLNLKDSNVRSAVAGLARDSYVQWNPQTEQITLLPKATHYVVSSRGKKDYDHIAIKSLSPSGKNATLNLNNNDLIVRGVDRFNFSDDSITVYVKPDSSIIRIQKNRGVQFNGTVVASAFVFKGKEFKFDYDGFFIELTKIDSIIVKGKGSKGSVMRARREQDFTLTNKDKQSSGKLFINRPDNKSGRKKLGAYPSFDASTGAYVFFNNPEVLGGAYDTTIYFDIPPFKIDSLNNVNRSAIGFAGTFNSGNIMPKFKTKLSLQDDGALGFNYDLPKEGFPVYGGKGRIFNKVRMSNRGLQSMGDLKYLTGTFGSEQFIFYKDSVVTVGKTGIIAQGPLNNVEFTNVSLLPGYQMKWVVKADSMYLSTQRDGQPMKMYANAYSFKGTTILTPGGLYGDGRMDGPQSFIRSPQFAFKPTSYSGKRSTFSIKSAQANKPALTANNVAFSYDVKGGSTEFAREEGDNKSSIDLPYSEYKTTLSGGKWDFKKKIVQLRVAAGADSSRSYFYSTKPEQHGLKFRAATGQYDLSRYRLIAGGVPYIAAADAWIMPDSSKVYVMAGAQMRGFKNAGIVMDSIAKFHNLYNGEITIQSRTAFTGTALYKYKNATADSFAIKFSSFNVDSAAATRGALAQAGKGGGKGFLRAKKSGDTNEPFAPPTVAIAKVADSEKFHLAPRIAYRGNVALNSQQRGFTFDGQSRLEFSKNANASQWFAVQDSIDPKALKIKILEPKTEDGAPMHTGLFVSSTTSKLYPLYVATKPDVTDMNLFTVDGALTFDAKKHLFTISRIDPNNPDIYEGNVMTFADSSAAVTLRGKLNLINSNKDYTLTAAGLGTAKPDSNKYALDTFLAFDINMPEKAVEAMADDIARNTKGAPEALDGSQAQLYKMGEFIGNKEVQNYATRKSGYVALQKVSSKFLHTLVLNKVDLRWSEKQKAWYSVGKIGLASVGKKDINALIDGYIEIKKEATGDAVELYLEAEPLTWYYIKYTNNVLLAKAQHGTFDEIIGLKAKGDYNTATQYGFYLGDDQTVQDYLVHFRKEYNVDNKGKKAAPVVSSGNNYDTMEESGKKKKKKGKGDSEEVEQIPQTADAPMEETGKKKKKGKEEAGSAFDTGATPPAAPAEDTSKKKKKEEKVEEATPPADAPTEDPKKEKKKKKKGGDDPFGE
ncbi:hypothetical protein [Hymenobacter cavernae]|uniref:Translocation/assembly module TamB n=1 Tax=Hymenobacter cavernae TaxID=2044852 RepID=A0ABQ1TXQ1_9BACT|nr:hypothetical protein [Hymenobacter cavernae]GGF05654.1 hypothetical protein GCM10011383_15940 [Hymenobacter cavernae]